MSAPETPARARAPMWMRVALVGSLAVNLLIAGVVIGAVVTRGKEDGPADRMRAARGLAPPPFVLALEPETRREMIGAFRAASEPWRDDRRALRRELMQVLDAIRAEPFDPSPVAGFLAGQREKATGRQAAGGEVLVRYLEGLSAAERAAYADRLEAALRRGPKPPRQ